MVSATPGYNLAAQVENSISLFAMPMPHAAL
jgi:hypothetical protein